MYHPPPPLASDHLRRSQFFHLCTFVLWHLFKCSSPRSVISWYKSVLCPLCINQCSCPVNRFSRSTKLWPRFVRFAHRFEKKHKHGFIICEHEFVNFDHIFISHDDDFIVGLNYFISSSSICSFNAFVVILPIIQPTLILALLLRPKTLLKVRKRETKRSKVS